MLSHLAVYILILDFFILSCVQIVRINDNEQGTVDMNMLEENLKVTIYEQFMIHEL